MREGRQPASVEIALSAITGSIAPVSYSCLSVAAEVRDEVRQKFHFHTIQAGALAMSILRRDPPTANYGSLESRAVPRELDVSFGNVRAIFPPVHNIAKWPPENVLDWDGFMSFSLRGQEIPADWEIPDEFMPESNA